MLAVSELPEPELTPLEEWRTKEGGPVEEPLTEPSSKVVCEKGDDDGDGDVDVDKKTLPKKFKPATRRRPRLTRARYACFPDARSARGSCIFELC